MAGFFLIAKRYFKCWFLMVDHAFVEDLMVKVNIMVDSHGGSICG
jgi:hypothetical protein